MFLSVYDYSKIPQMTCNSSPVLLSATLIPFSLITVLLTTVSVILGVVNYRLKMKMKLNETTLDVQTVEIEKISEYASVSIDVKTTSTSHQHQVQHSMHEHLTEHYLQYCPCRIQMKRWMPMKSWNTLSEINCGIYDWIINTIAR